MDNSEKRPPQPGERWYTYWDGIGEVVSNHEGTYRMKMDSGHNLTFSRTGLKHRAPEVPKISDEQLLAAVDAKIAAAQAEVDKWTRVRAAWEENVTG